MEIWRTFRLCAVCLALGAATVWFLWPPLRGLTIVQALPSEAPPVVAFITASLLLFVITHMERGHMDPRGYCFLMVYGLSCLAFGLSTIPASQNNYGTAVMEMAFVYMLLWKAFQKWRTND